MPRTCTICIAVTEVLRTEIIFTLPVGSTTPVIVVSDVLLRIMVPLLDFPFARAIPQPRLLKLTATRDPKAE
jgi:hypothetical protein